MRLCAAALPSLPAEIETPRYDRSAVRAGVVHLGVGAFHRAHQARYLDQLLARDPRWGVAGVSLRRPDMAAALAPQDGLYTLIERGPGAPRFQVIGALLDVLVAPEAPAAVLSRIAAPEAQLVTLTITEKGYARDPASGALDRGASDIAADLARPEGAAPSTALGFLTEGLARRRAAGLEGLTLLSCDNLPNNGVALRSVLLAFAEARDPALAAWIEARCAFPSAMVDRIVPASTEADWAEAAAALGVEDAWPVSAEPFSQWVIEDRFAAARPALETVGAEMVADVAPYERMKLRMLNGAHSTLAYLGVLAGRATVADAIAEPAIRAVASGLMREEAAPTVGLPADMLAAYADRLEIRFDNPVLKHRTAQIAMDGSQKLPQRLLGTIRDRIAADLPYENAALGVAAWIRHTTGEDDNGRPIALQDPLAETLRARAAAAGRDGLADAMLAVEAVFGDLAANPAFKASVSRHLRALFEHGAVAASAAAKPA